MPREKYLLSCLSGLFTEKRNGFARRKDDVEKPVAASSNGTSHSNGNGLPRVCRWVQIDGKTVRFSQGIGPFQGRVHIHHLPSLSVAREFAAALLKTDEDGYPAPLDPVEWAGWQGEYDHV